MEDIIPERGSIVGKWQLIETCVSPGNGGCTLIKISNGEIIQFLKDNSYKVTINTNASGLWTCGGTWSEKTSANQLQELNIVSSCASPIHTFYWSFNMDGTLNISPQCFEGCRYTFKKLD